MCPITRDDFLNGGSEPEAKHLQVDILAMLHANPDVAISAIEFENMFNKRRQVIHQALKALESKHLIVRGFVKQNNRNVCFVTLKTSETKSPEDGINEQPPKQEETTTAVAGTENTTEVQPTTEAVAKPRRKRSKTSQG